MFLRDQFIRSTRCSFYIEDFMAWRLIAKNCFFCSDNFLIKRANPRLNKRLAYSLKFTTLTKHSDLHSIREEDHIETPSKRVKYTARELLMRNIASMITNISHRNQGIGVEFVWGSCGVIQ